MRYLFAFLLFFSLVLKAEDVSDVSLNVVKVYDFTTEDPKFASVLRSEDEEFSPFSPVKGDENREQAKSSADAVRKSSAVAKSVTYTVRGKTYRTLSTAENFSEQGEASWYGPGFHGKKTASGEIYDMHAMTAAHKELPLGSTVKVTNLENGKSVVVRINDRGPFHGDRIIDLSKAAAQALDVVHSGVAEVSVEVYR